MKPLPPPGEPAASPCVDVCRMNPVTGLCEGCWRTLDEIAAWGRWDDAQRRAVWQQLPRRAAAQGQAPAREDAA